ncbi:MAG: PrsW family intramembrane metalloprotease [Treponematales bacterium]
MQGAAVFLLLMSLAALPVFLAFWWFRRRRVPLPLPWFLASLAAGAASVFIAGLLQAALGALGLFAGEMSAQALVLSGVFVRGALTEEASRLFTLVPLFLLRGALSRRAGAAAPSMPSPADSLRFGVAAGLTAGLGFALVENATYGAANLNIALLRAVTAAPLHGACGGRAGCAAAVVRRQPVRAVFRFLSAVVIHGMYNLILINPVLPSALAALIALAALASSVQELRRGESGS